MKLPGRVPSKSWIDSRSANPRHTRQRAGARPPCRGPGEQDGETMTDEERAAQDERWVKAFPAREHLRYARAHLLDAASQFYMLGCRVEGDRCKAWADQLPLQPRPTV